MENNNNIWEDFDWSQIAEEGSPESEHITEKQKQILLAAAELFGEKGYAATTTKEIAVKAGVAEGTIFKHYKTKKDLMMNLTVKIVGKIAFPLINTGLDEIFDEDYDTLEDFFRTLIKNRLELMKKAMPLIRIILQELPFHPELREVFIKIVKQIRIWEAFEKLKEKGMMVDISADELVKLFVACLLGYLFTHYILIPEFFNEDPKKEQENFIEFMVRGLSVPAE